MAGTNKLTIATFNLHGINQGRCFLESLCSSSDIVFVQEHWLAPFDLHHLYNIHDDTICYASSAMDAAISRGCLSGRPFGGVAVFVKKALGGVTKLVKAATRYIIIQVGQFVLANVYLPCAATPNRTEILIDCLACILNDIADLHYSYIIVGGDMNIDVAKDNELCTLLHNFCQDLDLMFVYNKLPISDRATFRVDTTGATSIIDHFAVSRSLYNTSVQDVNVVDSGINFSDHCALVLGLSIPDFVNLPKCHSKGDVKHMQAVYRWDLGDINQYYLLSEDLLKSIDAPVHLLWDGLLCDRSDILSCINHYYNDVICSLLEASRLSIPRKKHGFQKYWWDEELSLLKQQAIQSFSCWAAAGKPRQGVIFYNMNRDKAAYKLAIKTKEKNSANEFSDSLNDALMNKDMDSFWKSWRSKFGFSHTPRVIDGLCVDQDIADRFASVFEAVCVPNSVLRHKELEANFFDRYPSYMGHEFNVSAVTSDLIHDCINKLKKGKAPGLDELTSEHILFAHPIIEVHLSLLFKMLLKHSIVPDGFGYGVVIPLIKNSDGNHFISDNYRGITISPVISKLFESVLLQLFGDQLSSDSLQFGFKQRSSCNHALFTLRTVVNHYVADNSTINICALDISKAFDRVDHFALLQQLMDRNIPRMAIGVLLDWLQKSFVCVRWGRALSFWYRITAGVRQGGILSPVLFAIYMDTLIARLRSLGLGCRIFDSYYGCLLYADDILLLSHSVNAMRLMLAICEQFASEFDLKFNSSKSVAMRIGVRYKAQCAPLSLCGGQLKFVSELKYLGVCLVAAKCFKISVNQLKVKFFRVFNCIYARSKAANSEMVTVELLKAYCLPFLLYGLESVSPSKSQLRSLNNCINRAVFKVFGVNDAVCVNDLRCFVGLHDVEELVERRRLKFVDRLISSSISLDLFLANGL